MTTSTISLVKRLPRHAAETDPGATPDLPVVILNLDRFEGGRLPFRPGAGPLLPRFGIDDIAERSAMLCQCGHPWLGHAPHCRVEVHEDTGLVRFDGSIVWRVIPCPCTGMVT